MATNYQIAAQALVPCGANNVWGPPTTLTSGSLSPTAANTAQQLVAANTPALRVTIAPLQSTAGAAYNTDAILIGASSTSCVFALAPGGAPITIEVDDASKIWVKSLHTGDGVQYLIQGP